MKRAALLVVGLVGCPASPELPPGTAPPASASTTAEPRSSATPAPSAAPIPSASASASAPVEIGPEQLQALTTELQSRRVFRHLTLGNMPAERERHSWMLSEDGRHLTLACEQGDPGRVESGSPEPKRWFLAASASFVADAVPAGQAWAPVYRRERIVTLPRIPWTVCGKVGEALAMACSSAKEQLYGAHAFVPVETRREAPIRWQPGTRRAVAGLACEVKAGVELPFYDFPDSSAGPMLFFGEKKQPVERLIHSDAVQYAGFREAVLSPFDGSVPPHLRAP